MAGVPTPPDPWSSGIMAGAGVAGKALDDKTNQTLNNAFNASFDNSGWNVNTKSDGATQSTNSGGLLGALGPMLQNPVVLLALAAAAYLYLKRK